MEAVTRTITARGKSTTWAPSAGITNQIVQKVLGSEPFLFAGPEGPVGSLHLIYLSARPPTVGFTSYYRLIFK